MEPLADFRQVWLCDFEFGQPDGELPTPLCMVAREWRTGRTLRLWQDQLAGLRESPIPHGPARCLSPISLRRSWAATCLSAGRCRPVCSTCTRSFVV
jgi:hypothetical protein